MERLLLLAGRSLLVWLLTVTAVWCATSFFLYGVDYDLCIWLTALTSGLYVLGLTFVEPQPISNE